MRKKNNAGFSLVELIMTIAILAILFGIGFVAVASYQKSLKLNEMDGIAKEILHASQNQISKAKENGQLDTLISYQKSQASKLGIAASNENEYYIVYGGSGAVTGADALNVILPFGSIDEFVRGGGSYIIRYNVKTGQILQAFYKEVSASNPGFTSDDVNTLKGQTLPDKNYQKNYSKGVIGFAHAEGDAGGIVSTVKKPSITVKNEEILYADATTEGDVKVLLCIHGLTSDGKWTISTNEGDKVNNHWILDDITDKDRHFESVVSGSTNTFIPGEDIEVFVTVQNNSGLSMVVESDHIITNSLFGSIVKQSTGSDQNNYTATISNVRHLENLSQDMSSVNSVDVGTGGKTVYITKAEQVSDIDYTDFKTNITTITGANNRDIIIDNSKKATGQDYYPVKIDTAKLTEYNGKNCLISNVTVANGAANAGLFGEISNTSFKINNLELHNFKIKTSAGNAGTLIGNATATLDLSNIVAFNCSESSTGITTQGFDDAAYSITTSGGSAGGLIGSMAGGTVDKCAAAVYVVGTTNAGGLIGTANAATVTNSYAGGHTANGLFLTDAASSAADSIVAGRFNVKATGNDGVAGGLIGSASNSTSISNCYSTCSVYGASVYPVASTLNVVSGALDLKNEQGTTEGDNPKIYYTCKDTTSNTYGTGWLKKSEANAPVYYPYFENTDVSNTKGILRISSSRPTDGQKYNIDSYWSSDLFPTRTVLELNGYVAATNAEDDAESYDHAKDLVKDENGNVIWFLESHVGDWAYPEYKVDIVNTPNNTQNNQGGSD